MDTSREVTNFKHQPELKSGGDEEGRNGGRAVIEINYCIQAVTCTRQLNPYTTALLTQ
jgi:hypothetical protein